VIAKNNAEKNQFIGLISNASVAQCRSAEMDLIKQLQGTLL
jgi:hypothetical protein